MKLGTYDRLVILVSVVGIFVSTYALYVELKVEADPNYEALCNLSEVAKCTNVLSSKYAKGLGIADKDSIWRLPNPIFGTIHFCIMIILSSLDSVTATYIQLFLGFASIATNCYLAYILAFVLKDICVVCISLYVVNITAVYLVWRKFKRQLKKSV